MRQNQSNKTNDIKQKNNKYVGPDHWHKNEKMFNEKKTKMGMAIFSLQKSKIVTPFKI